VIGYLLLRIAARANRITMLPLRLAELISHLLFARRAIAQIDELQTANRNRPLPISVIHNWTKSETSDLVGSTSPFQGAVFRASR